MHDLPAYVDITFGLTTFLAAFFLYKASHERLDATLLVLAWLLTHGIVSINGFYANTSAFPPRMFWLMVPIALIMIALFATSSGRRFVDGLDLKWLTLLHIVRIPVEIVLYWLFLYKAVPELMTFVGRNFDILAGLTAPFLYYYCFVKSSWSRQVLLVWNLVCLGLVVNIVVHAFLSAPTPFQSLSFDQPNIAVLHFPYVWLAGFVAPLAIFSHLVAIRRLWFITT